MPGAEAVTRRRLFLALYPALGQRQLLLEAVNQHCPGLLTGAGRPVPVANLHMTLEFFGPVSAEVQACIEQVAATVDVPAFSLCVDRLGYWPRKRMLWAMPEPAAVPEGLNTLVSALRRGLRDCDVELEQRPYRPHITLMRKLARGPRDGRMPPVSWSLDRFVLMESVSTPAGVQYPIVQSWPLRAD